MIKIRAGGNPGAVPAVHMLHHLSLAVSDLKRSAGFYDPALAALGYVRAWTIEDAIGYGTTEEEDKFAIKFRQKVNVPGSGFHVAFAGPSRDAVRDFHRAALAHGGTDNGGVGIHPEYGEDYFASFVIDPDGYWIEAVVRGPA